MREDHISTNDIVDHRLALDRNLKAQSRLISARNTAITAKTVVAGCGITFRALVNQFSWTVTGIELPRVIELVGKFSMAGLSSTLKVGAFIGLQAQPVQS